MPGGPQAQGNGHHGDEQEAQDAETQRHQHLGGDQVPHGLSVIVGHAQVSGEEAQQPLAVPHQEGPVQSQILPQGSQLFRRGLGTQHGGGRVAGNHVKGQKGQKRDNDHGDKQHDNSLCRILHGSSSPFSLLDRGIRPCSGGSPGPARRWDRRSRPPGPSAPPPGPPGPGCRRWRHSR